MNFEASRFLPFHASLPAVPTSPYILTLFTWSALALVLSRFIYLFPPPVFDLSYCILTQSGVLLQWAIVFIVISEDSVSTVGPGRGSFASVWVNLLRYEASYLIFIYSTSCHIARVFDLHALSVVPRHCYLPSSADTLTGQRSAATSGSCANVTRAGVLPCASTWAAGR